MGVFAKKMRLNAPKRFQELFRFGEKFGYSSFWLRSLPNKRGHARLGLVLAKKKFRGR